MSNLSMIKHGVDAKLECTSLPRCLGPHTQTRALTSLSFHQTAHVDPSAEETYPSASSEIGTQPAKSKSLIIAITLFVPSLKREASCLATPVEILMLQGPAFEDVA